jgi:hypothetical protein
MRAIAVIGLHSRFISDNQIDRVNGQSSAYAFKKITRFLLPIQLNTLTLCQPIRRYAG